MNPSPVMVHPSQLDHNSSGLQRPPVSVPRPMAPMVPLQEVFIVIVSKHSPSCSKIFETVKFIAPHLNTKILEIDNPEVRDLVLQSGKIKTVPTIALMYPQENKVDFYEGPSALQLLQQKVEEVQQKIQRIAASSQKSTDISQVLGMPPQTQMAIPVQGQMPIPPQGQMPMNMPPQYPPQAQYPQQQYPVQGQMPPQQQYPPQYPVQGQMPMAMPPQGQYPPQGQMPMTMPPEHFADPTDMRASPLDRNPATVSFHEEAAAVPSDIMGGTLIDDSAYEVDMGNGVPQGMSREEIMGGDQAIINREKDKKSKANQGRMEAMMREREEMDKKTQDPRMARRP